MEHGILGAILTGGRSRRMGSDKSEVLVGDATMLERIGQKLAAVTDRVVILGPASEGWVSWADLVDAEGPLAGIVTALERSDRRQVLVVAVDQPFARTETLTHLTELAGDLPVVPVDRDGVRQVTCALYPTALAGVAREEAESGGSIQSLLDRVSFRPVPLEEWESWGEDGRSWFSVDDAAKLDLGLALFGR